MTSHTIPEHAPDPGPDVAFRHGIPVLVVDQHGRTHVTRNRTQYNAATTA